MTYEEAQQRAREMGALKPQNIKENMAAGTMAYNGQSFAQTPLAQSRLHAWALAIMRGEDPR